MARAKRATRGPRLSRCGDPRVPPRRPLQPHAVGDRIIKLRAVLFTTVLLAACLVVEDLEAPLASAAASSSTNEHEIWSQITDAGINGGCQYGSCPFAHGPTPNAGTYIVTAGFSSNCGTDGWDLTTSSGSSLISIRTGATTLTNNAPGTVSNIDLLSASNVSSGLLAVIRFTLATSTALKLQGHVTGSCNQFYSGEFGQTLSTPSYGVPPGTLEQCATGLGQFGCVSSVMGLVGVFVEATSCCGSDNCAGNNCHIAGYLFNDPSNSLLSEVTIENAEATTNAHVGNVIGTGFNPASTMQQINSEYALVATSTSGNLASPGEIVQSFTPDATKGSYVGHTTFRLASGIGAPVPACSGGTVSVSMTSVDMVTNGGAWNASNESANITAALTKPSGGTFPTTMTIDWANGTLSDGSGVDSYSGVTLSIGGSSTGVTSSMLPPFTSGATMFFRLFTTCISGNSAIITPSYSTSTLYAGGAAYTRASGSTGAFATQAGDMESLTVGVYGGTTYSYSLAATGANVGGALYAYVYEIIRDASPQQYTLSTSFGGGARFGTYQYAAGTSTQQVNCKSWYFVQKCTGGVATSCPDNSCVVLQEWRLGYITPEWTTSTTWTLTVNDTGSGRNQLFVAIINTANEPSHTDMSLVQWTPTTSGYAPFQSYQFFSTNDYYATLNLTVYACKVVNADGSCGDQALGQFGSPIPNGSFSGTIVSGGSRFVGGAWSPNGTFNLTGQDVQGGTIHLTISAQGYVADSNVVINVPNTAGSYTANLTMLPALQGSGLGVVQSAVQVVFNATNPQFADGQLVTVSVNRTLNVDLWVVLFKLDGNGNPLLAGGFAPYDWTPSQNNELDVAWPDGRTLNDADSGAYILSVLIGAKITTKGVLVAYDPIGVNQAAPTAGTSLLTNLNVAGQNDISTQSQVNAAVSSGAVTELTVQQDFLTFLDWFPRTDLLIPNAVLYPCLFMVGALMLRFGRQRWGA